MQRLLALLLIPMLLLTACGSDGAGESVLEALGLSENVDIESPTVGEPDGPIGEALEDIGSSGFNGIVLLDQGGNVRIATFGTADGDDGPPIDDATVFDIGSITKQFTGAAIVRMEMEELLSVDDTLGTHLPEVHGPLAEVTLHQLLTHTAGLPDGIGDDYEAIDRAAFVERAMDRAGEPGDHRYSNVGYSLLGMVIETVSGGSYEDYLRTALFEPAGMDATGYVLPDWSTRTIAVGYDAGERLAAPNDLPWADDGPWWNLRANGGILSTAADMRRWHEALEGERILSAEAKAKLFGRHTLEGQDAETWYGYGWVSFPLGEDRWFHGHNGGNGIFFADVLRFPDDDLFVFVATNTSGADEDAAFRLADAALDADLASDCPPPGDPTSFPVVDTPPATDAGTTMTATIDIFLGGDEADRRTFAEQHVSEELAQGLTIDDQVDEIALLQEEFIGYTVHMLHLQDENIVHAVLDGPSAGRAILSVVVDEANPEHVACVDLRLP